MLPSRKTSRSSASNSATDPFGKLRAITRSRLSLIRSASSASTRSVASRETPTTSTGMPAASRMMVEVISTCRTDPSLRGWSTTPLFRSGRVPAMASASADVTRSKDSGVIVASSGSARASSTEIPRSRVIEGLM